MAKDQLKRSAEKTSDTQAHEGAVSTAVSFKTRVLLVDDELAILLTLRAILEMNDFEVDTAESAREAEKKLKQGVFEIVVTDMRMETETAGYDVIRVARQQDYHPATAILTAYPSLGCEWRNHGAKGLWIKPISTNELLRGIEMLLITAQDEKNRGVQRQKTVAQSRNSPAGSRVSSDSENKIGSANSHNSILTWIHLSDLHMESADSFNRRVVLDALWRDIKKLVDGGLRPDFIAFTGDTAFHGLPEEYTLAQELFFQPLLATTALPKDRLFAVPGNHDVNRRRTELLGNPLPSLRSEDDIRKVLENDDKREVLTSSLAGYRSFEASYLGSNVEKSSLAAPSSTRIAVGEWKIAIVTLNSTWLSGFNRNAAGEIDDCAHLAIGELQAHNAFASDSEAHFRIVLVHHPFDWLLEFDRFVVQELIARARSLVLHGHLHRPDAQLTSSLAGDLITIPSGSVFDNRCLPNAYNVVQLDLSTGLGTIYFRRYNNRRGEWQKDLDSTGEILDGRVQFKLPASWRLWQSGEVRLEKDTRRVTDYSCVFTTDCKQDMKTLGLSESDVLELVQSEFRSHLNYFLFDLEDYPLPLKSNYILYLDKVNLGIEFRKIVRCTADQAKLAAWNDVLTLYRRATRLAYRDEPDKLLFVRGLAERTCELHRELLQRLQKYFEDYEGVASLAMAQFTADKKVSATRKSKKTAVDPAQVIFRIRSAKRSCEEASHTSQLLEVGDITQERGIGLIVLSLEQSLQHVHKLIVQYPPATGNETA